MSPVSDFTSTHSQPSCQTGGILPILLPSIVPYSPTPALPELLAEAARAVDPATRPLLPWQSAFAEWLSSQPTKVSVQAQRKIASSLAKTLVTARALGRLRRNARFVSYLASLQLDEIRRARAVLEEHYTEGITTHIAGMRMAMAAEDHKSLPSYTVPILDRVVPKRDAVQGNTQVNVTLTTKQTAQLDAAIAEVEYEVLPPPPGVNA